MKRRNPAFIILIFLFWYYSTIRERKKPLLQDIFHKVRVTNLTQGGLKAMEELAKLEDVFDIKKLEAGSSVTRELILVKLRVQESSRQEILSVIEIFRGKVVDVTRDSMVIELTGNQDKLSAFLDLVSGFEILELARTGITGLTRGSSDVTYLE